MCQSVFPLADRALRDTDCNRRFDLGIEPGPLAAILKSVDMLTPCPSSNIEFLDISIINPNIRFVNSKYRLFY
jgi:hypothetical protein